MRRIPRLSACLALAALVGAAACDVAPESSDAPAGVAASDTSSKPGSVTGPGGSYVPITDELPADAGSKPSGNDTPDATTGSDPYEGLKLEPPTSVFDPLGLHVVKVTLPAATWDSYLEGVKTLTKEYVPADVTIDGTTYTNVGLRQFGDGSQQTNPAKANIRIKFNQYVPKQYGPEELRNLRLKASGADASFLREPIVYELIRSLGAAAPRTSWARVEVNGQDYGPYQVMEQIDSRMFQHFYGNKDGANYDPVLNCMGLNCPPEGCDALASYYEVGAGDFSEMLTLAKAIDSASDADLVATLNQLVDVDDLMAVYAVEAVTADYDGLAASGFNFEVYGDEATGKLRFIRHGADSSFKIRMDPFKPYGEPNTWCGGHEDALFKRIVAIPELDQKLREKMQTLHCGAFATETLTAFIEEYRARLHDQIYADPKGIAPDEEITGQIDHVKGFVVQRNLELREELGECSATSSGGQ